MGKKWNKALLNLTVGGFIAVNTIIHPNDEEPHIHPQDYLSPAIYEQFPVVVSGTLLTEKLPDFIVDLGASPLNPNEKLFGIIPQNEG